MTDMSTTTPAPESDASPVPEPEPSGSGESLRDASRAWRDALGFDLDHGHAQLEDAARASVASRDDREGFLAELARLEADDDTADDEAGADLDGDFQFIEDLAQRAATDPVAALLRAQEVLGVELDMHPAQFAEMVGENLRFLVGEAHEALARQDLHETATSLGYGVDGDPDPDYLDLLARAVKLRYAHDGTERSAVEALREAHAQHAPKNVREARSKMVAWARR